MGNAESGGTGSGDEEDIEAESPSFTEGGPASAAATGSGTGGGGGGGSGGGGGGGGSAAGGSGSGRSGRGLTHAPVAGSGLPSPEALMDQVRLREAAGRAGDTNTLTVSESAIARNESALVRWLEERLGRGEEALTLEQFCDMLESRDAQRDECEEAFGQFDAEGDGVVDVESMLMALKNSNGANLQGELSHVIRQLQACSLTPGFVDIFSKSKDRIGAHASKILKFLHRNRIPSSAIPFPFLDGYNSISSMRAAVLQDYLDCLLQKEKDLDIQYGTELSQGPEVDRVRVVSQCYSSIEASSNGGDIFRMTNGDTVSYWQSDGSARSHWIRLKLKPDVVLRRLAIAVASSDHSYMPQLVSVAVGKSRRSLQEIRDIRIPSNVTGYVPLLDNANISQPYVQINIKRCLSDGCDTRIHGLKTMGYQVTKSREVSVSDASAIWYLSLLTSLVTASMETNPALANTVLQSTQKALEHMPPLSLSSSSNEFPKFFSPNILEEVDAFLLRIADCCVTPDAELTLLAFALARGSVMKLLLSLAGMCERVNLKYRAASLLASMASVRLQLLYRNGKTLQLRLQACDVKSRDDKSGPENMLTDPSTGDGFLTESGKTRASVILSTEDQTCFQITQIRIKVRKGAIGAKCGLVFAYNDSEVFDADKHFKKFRKYDSWDFKDYKEFVKDKHSNKGAADWKEENPVGWFELEDDWNDVEIKLQHFRVTNFLMVKFVCVRQDSAERLGVQQLAFSGYVCPDSESMGEEEELEEQLNTRAQGVDCGPVTGLMLIRKTLYFIQQLTRDMDMMLHKQKSLLDFSGLNLPLFWDFYRKLRSIGGEEAMKAQVLLLQLLQNCFSALPALPESRSSPESTESSSSSPSSSAARASASTDVDPAEAVGELYSHLCQVVDGSEGESSLEKALKKQAVKTILGGAAIFYPDKKSRRDKLFDMMKNLTEEAQPESAKLTFESLCNYFSDQDPSGLLLLPPKEAPADFDISPILSVMDTLLLVATKECEMLMVDNPGGPSRKVLLSLFWALQGSLLSWCFLQLKGGVVASCDLARDILIKYVAQFLANTQTTLSSLLETYSAPDIIAKLGNSISTMATRQLALFLLEMCALDIPHCIILRSFFSLLELLKKLSCGVEESSKGDVDGWQHPQQPVVLRTWVMESPHNYEDSKHENTVFLCPGATYFEVEFDERCETEKRYDYLEFTDYRGGKVRYDMKVGTEKWPKKVTFKAGHQLQFLFHSDSSNTEWGYKFTVTAFGLPDISVSWISDLQLLVSRLMGRLASRTMALKSTQEVHSMKEIPAAVMNHVISSPLWKPVFTHGLIGPARSRELEYCSNDTKQTKSVYSGDDLVEFLVDFARWDPSRESCDERTELMRNLMLSCKKQLLRSEIAVGSKVDHAVNAIWAAMVYHTPALQTSLRNFVVKQGQSCLTEDLFQVYMLADGIRTWMLEMKQRSMVIKMNGAGEKGESHIEVTPESLAEICISKTLLLFRFNPDASSAPPPHPDPCKIEETPVVPVLPVFPYSVSISEGDFQACPAPSTSSSSQSPIKVEAQMSAPSDHGASSSGSAQDSRGSTESLHSQCGEPVSPLTFSRRAPFSRGRLRLLSYRSVEETRPTPSVKDRYPILKHIFSFVKDMVISETSILQTLALKKSQTTSVCEVLDMVQQFLLSMGKPHLFQAPCILFLQELLACQKDFTNYFSQLSGCGPDLKDRVRSSYHQLIHMLVEAVQGFSKLNDKVLLPALSCVQTCLLHLLDMSWEVQDLPLFEDIRLPDLLLTMSQENISVHDIAISQWTEEDEIADFERNTEWMDECMDGMFEKWFDKISQASPEDKRKMHMFIARYCDLLNVEISCDGCERIAPGHRYRCLQCTDMDLCKTCFLSGAKPEGHEDEHEMVNMEYACDHCQGLIVGSRINCNVCEDFDLCFGCYNTKKYPDSHLPTHRITVYPMVTIRISDRHRLIQPYIHNYSWLLFASLALFTSELMCESTDPVTQGHAAALQSRCSQLITECLMKGQTGKGLRASALLSLLSSNEPEPCPPSPVPSQELSISDTSSLPGSTAALCSPPSFFLKTLSAEEKDERGQLVSQDTLDSPSLNSEGTLSPELRDADSTGDTITSATSENLNKEQEDGTPKGPLQEHVFAECSRERILGLLAAMLPPAKPGTTISLSGLSPILPLLFRVVISNAGCLNEAYHLTLGLLGQLLLRISPAEADAAVTEALSEKFELLAQANGAINDTPGWKTTQLLFSLGAVCLDSRIGLDWASSVADILRNLNSCPQWCDVIALFTDHCIQHLPHQLKRTNIFTLHVLVIFPEVLCMGTQSVFIDNANEQHNIILLKHFTEKNRAAVVDVKTRKRRTVKDYQLVQAEESLALSSHYLKNLISIVNQLLQTGVDRSSPDAVEATWVLSLALKGLYSILKKHGSEQAQEAMHSAGLMQLLVRKCSKGTGFSKTWLLRDLEILSIMLYSSKREIHSMAEESESGEREEDREREKEHDSDFSSCCAEDVDPLEGLDEETKACFQLTHDALNAPLHILRALYELQMKRTDSFFREVQKRFDGDVIKTDETIRTLAQKWQPVKRAHSDERHAKAVDTDMIIITCALKPSRCETATEETNAVTQKLITITESELQLSYAKQRRTKSSSLLHKELDARSNKAVRHYLFRVNEAISILYARHVLALLLAHWPDCAPIREEDLELSGASHMAHILDMLMQLEEKPLWEKARLFIKGCSQNMLDSLSLTACQFMEEPVMAMQVRESKHPYDNNTNFEDKVHIPGAFYLSVKFDSRCQTEDGCDELQLASSADFQQDLHTFSGSYHKWADVEIPGDTLYYRFTSDMSNTEWGYKFTVTGGHRGRFQTGFEILKQMLADDQALAHLPLADIWEWQVGVACRQTGSQRLKAIHLLLRILQCSTQWGCDLTLLRPLWQLFTTMEGGLNQDPTSITVLLPLHRALTELFFIAETKAM
ncbi:zinc finger ZZ-type and EF-hand domain-containing protein 1 isoform X2, partial [Silurus meridionalis]